jgi:hypothetical protein
MICIGYGELFTLGTPGRMQRAVGSMMSSTSLKALSPAGVNGSGSRGAAVFR